VQELVDDTSRGLLVPIDIGDGVEIGNLISGAAAIAL